MDQQADQHKKKLFEKERPERDRDKQCAHHFGILNNRIDFLLIVWMDSPQCSIFACVCRLCVWIVWQSVADSDEDAFSAGAGGVPLEGEPPHIDNTGFTYRQTPLCCRI